jgi:sec-independent protein translocase protein TatA
MGSFSIGHWLILLAVVLLLFGGRGKVSQFMGDFGKGLSAFKKGVGGHEETPPSRTGEPGDNARPITAQVTTAPSGGRVHRDTAANA